MDSSERRTSVSRAMQSGDGRWPAQLTMEQVTPEVIEKIAERVYRLLLAELRVSAERRGAIAVELHRPSGGCAK